MATIQNLSRLDGTTLKDHLVNRARTEAADDRNLFVMTAAALTVCIVVSCIGVMYDDAWEKTLYLSCICAVSCISFLTYLTYRCWKDWKKSREKLMLAFLD